MTPMSVIGAALVVAPFFINKSNVVIISLSQAYFFQLITLFGVLFFGINAKKWQIKLMAVLTVFSVVMSENVFNVMTMYQFLMAITGVMFIALCITHLKKINDVYFLLSIVCIVESIWIILNYFGVDPHFYSLKFMGFAGERLATNGKDWVPGLNAISSSLGHNTHGAALIAGTLPFLKKKFWPLPIMALYVADSSMGIFSAIVAISSLFLYKNNKEKLLVFVAVAMLALGIYSITGEFGSKSIFSDNGRVAAWKYMLDWTGFQFTGGGFGIIPNEFSQMFNGPQKFMQMHNEWLELYAIGGLLVLIPCLFLVAEIFINRGKPEINACLIALAFNSLGNFTFHIAPLFIVFGACYAIHITTKEKPWPPRQ